LEKTNGVFDKNKVRIKLIKKIDSVKNGGDKPSYIKTPNLSYENNLNPYFINWVINFLDINGDRSD